MKAIFRTDMSTLLYAVEANIQKSSADSDAKDVMVMTNGYEVTITGPAQQIMFIIGEMAACGDDSLISVTV